MSFSCIAFLRGFFDDNHFEDSLFVTDTEKEKGEHGLKIKLLKGNQSKEADGMIGWINGAISESLNKKYLKAVNLAIILDPTKPNEIFESYCFKINYSELGASLAFDFDVEVSPVKQTRKQIHQLLKRFIVITQSLPILPAKRFLSMQLLFNDKCEESYCPDKFVDCSNEPPAIVKLPINAIDEIDVSECGEMNSYHHKLVTSIISLATVDPTSIDESTIFKNIDPFGFMDDETTIIGEEEDSDKTQCEEMSQITKELNNLVHYDVNATTNNEKTQRYKELSIETESLSVITCECGSSKPLSFSSTINCSTCDRYVHRSCYAVKENDHLSDSTFQCITCQGIELNDDFKILFIIRKILAWLNTMEKPNLISVNNMVKYLGYHTTNKDPHRKYVKKNTNLVINSISVLIYDGILTLKARKAFFYTEFQVDYEGLLLNKMPISKGKYFVNYSRNSESVNKYTNSNMMGIAQHIDDNRESMAPLESSINDENIDKEMNQYINFPDDSNIKIGTNRKKRKVTKSVDLFPV